MPQSHSRSRILFAAAALLVAWGGARGQVFRGYYSDGAIKFESREDRRIRVIRGFYPDGVLQFVATYKRGELDGTVKEYYPNGLLMAEVEYRNNRRHGLAKFYHESGMLMGKIYYRRGVETGKAKFYDDAGRLTGSTNSEDRGRDRSRRRMEEALRGLENRTGTARQQETE